MQFSACAKAMLRSREKQRSCIGKDVPISIDENVCMHLYVVNLINVMLQRGYIEFKYYADAIHSGLTLPG